MGRWATGRSLRANRRLSLHNQCTGFAGPRDAFVASRACLRRSSCRSRCRVKEEPWSSPHGRGPSILR